MTVASVGSNSKSDDPCVAVIGTGRSGTSATAGLLIKLGLSGPDGDDLLGATESNQSGHWESRAVIRCNLRLLRSVGAAGQAPPPTTLDWSGVKDHAKRTAEARQWYQSAHTAGPVMVKDPRMAHTLGFWRTALPAPMAAVFVLRHPVEMARSLNTRDGVPMSLGLSLWDRSNRSASLGLKGLPTLVLLYDQMLSEPVEGTAKVVEFLNQLGIGVAPEAQKSASSWFNPRLHHERSELDEYSDMAGVQREMFSRFSACAGIHSSWDPPTSFPEPQLWVDDCIQLSRRNGRLRVQLREIQGSRVYRVATALDKAKSRLTKS
jgi:hypothetical protein